jgi:AraC-like DNA-binding protein
MAFELVPIQTEVAIDGFHSIYYFEFDIDFYHPPETHDFWELVYVDYGRINAIVDGVGCALSSGQVIFHQPMEPHSHIGNGRDAGNVVVISFSCKSPIMSFFNRKIFTLEKSSQKILSLFISEATTALGGICGDYNDTSPLDFSNAPLGSTQLMQGYLAEFLFSLIRSNHSASITALEATSDARQMAENSLVNSIIYYMEDNLEQAPSLTALCQYFCVGRTYLCRIFRAVTGDSAVDYWIALKIREAKRLIREGNMNVTQIAEALGYSSIHHFTRMFKRATGLSPTAYKSTIVR